MPKHLFRCKCKGGVPPFTIVESTTNHILGDLYRRYEWNACGTCKTRVSDFSVRQVWKHGKKGN